MKTRKTKKTSAVTGPEVTGPPVLRDCEWKRFLRGPDTSLLEDLYIPALECAVRYDRCCAYFSSRVLSVAARGFGKFIENLVRPGSEARKPAARLLVNEQLDPDDLEALLATGDQSALSARLMKRFRKPADALEKHRLEMLTWLVAQGWLEVRVGVMRTGRGILHAKFGIVTDQAGDTLAFMGSDNETGEALTGNYEELTLGQSWLDEEFATTYRQRFDTLWSDADPNVRVVKLPDAVREALIKLAPKETPSEPAVDASAAEAAMVWNYIAAAPFLPDGDLASDATAMVDLWPHQRKVVEDTAKAFPAGRLLCDEVGMGKTIEAALVLRRLILGRGVRRALLLVPAGLLRQWQDELREKAGLLVPVWDSGYLVRSGDRREAMTAAEALERCDMLLLSREWARLDQNKATVLTSREWDLTLVDEAHAARRRQPEEAAFNTGNLLLALIRDMQLLQRTRGVLLLSATPMQTQPWEPWDLLTALGVGAPWMVEFGDIRTYYNGIATLRSSPLKPADASVMAAIAAADDEFPAPPAALNAASAAAAISNLPYTMPQQRPAAAAWLRAAAPLGRRMHRNTRDTLREYHRKGLLDTDPPRRNVNDETFDYDDQRERKAYDDLKTYIDRRWEQLEKEKPGKGFVMTIYRRRASSSPRAIRRSLDRRREKLERIIRRETSDAWLLPQTEDVDIQDLADQEMDRIDAGLPSSPQAARAEKTEIASLLAGLDDLDPTDSKLSKFWTVLQDITADGRSVLVFTEYTDTMEYLRDQLRLTYGSATACYSGEGGHLWTGSSWERVSKAEITARLFSGEIKVLVCTDAASEGLNLQAASALVNYDLPWNPSKVEQRIGRIDRIGQQQIELPIRNMFLRDSVDMKVYQALRDRCGLFERFVGPMQPVLALARQALRENLRSDGADAVIREIQEGANKASKDVLVETTFAASHADDVAASKPPLTRNDIEQALDLLPSADAPVSARKAAKRRSWKLRRRGKPIVEVSVDRETLERYGEVTPLVPGLDLARDIAASLPLGAALPLVVTVAEKGPYRCAEVRWLGSKKTEKVGCLGELRELIRNWDGTPPEPERYKKAEQDARRAADRRIRDAMQRADLAAAAGIRRQVASARARLRRELGRTLRCLGEGDLAALMRQHAAREPASGGRFRRAFHLLGEEASWSPDEVRQIDSFVARLSASARRSRAALSEVDAAFDDPRWKALHPRGQSF